MGQALPRVTEILAALGLGPDLSRVPAPVLEAARSRGSAVHAAIEADAYGYLDQADLTPEIAPYYLAYRQFVDESGHQPIASEIELIHPSWRYVCHPDRLGWLLGKRVLLDWKSGETPDLRAAGRQLAGYRLAWNATHPTEPVDFVAVVQLKADGKYRLHDEIVNDPVHEQVFLAAVVVYHASREEQAA